MHRPIIAYGQDEEGIPTALLSCGHQQHIRHNPPFHHAPWILTEEGRRMRLNTPLNCVRYDPDPDQPSSTSTMRSQASGQNGD